VGAVQIKTTGSTDSCAICERRLLRGERSDTFLHSGTREIVCELCVPRAVEMGWIREGSDSAPARGRIGWARREGDRRSLGARLFRRDRQEEPELLVPEEAAPLMEQPLVDDSGPVDPFVREPAPVPAPPTSEFELPQPPSPYREDRGVHAVPTNADMKGARAIEIFNGSVQPPTIVGLSKTLGAPLVSVLPSETEGSIVRIVIAWELSWYRYEVDLADEAAGARLIAQGPELTDLSEAERNPNAVCDQNGLLHTAVQAA